MERKGFPESYDVRRLIQFLEEVKRGEPEVRAPVYSHVVYDVVDGEAQVLREPDIVIVEGLNVLQTGAGSSDGSRFVSDWFDLTITVTVGGEEVPFAELFVALAEGQSHLILPSGTYFSLDREELSELAPLHNPPAVQGIEVAPPPTEP